MVCLYCKHATQVVNSRQQEQVNRVWRRRRCTACGAVFTTHEIPDYTTGLAIQMPDDSLRPFRRELLFLSVLQSCRHRNSAIEDALALTETAIKKMLHATTTGKIEAGTLVNTVHGMLQNFDHASGVQYAAYHSTYELTTQ